MTRLKFLLAAGLLCCSTFAQSARPDFSGTWKLNNGKSPDAPANLVYLETIEQSGNTIKVTTKAEGVTNELDGTFQITGKPHITNPAKNLYRFTKVSWEAGNTLIFEITDKDSKKELAKVTHYVRESWTSSPDGKVLTKFRRTASVGKPIVDQKYVFDKQ